MNLQNDVKMFMQAADQYTTETPRFTLQNDAQSTLYMNLICEEYAELNKAFSGRNMIETADAVADLVWVVLGLCNTVGIPFEKVWEEVKSSNMSKVSENGKILKRADGKILKPDTYFQPNIAPLLQS